MVSGFGALGEEKVFQTAESVVDVKIAAHPLLTQFATASRPACKAPNINKQSS